MKTLKFTPELCIQILASNKTSTWRLFDDKDLQTGDEVEFVNKETGERFGHALLSHVRETLLGKLIEEDWVGHNDFGSEESMYQTFQRYYNQPVDQDTPVKIIKFTFTKSLSN